MARTASSRTQYLLSIVVWLAIATTGRDAVRANDTSVSLRVEPQHAKLVGNLARLQLQVTGTDASGRQFDLTRDVSYKITSDGIASVSKTGAVVPLASGTGKIRVQHGTAAVEIPITITEVLPQAKVSFKRDVVPILSRAGCNQGACHGAQFGKGGFKLSLARFCP